VLGFKKLLNRTPEERRADMERIDREFDERQDALLAKRKQQLEAALALPGLSQGDRAFLQGLQSRATQVDIAGGRDGGRLLYLSEPQIKWLEDLAARAERTAAPPAAAANDIFARMARLQRGAAPLRTLAEEPGDEPPRPRN
jgi:hypothetical protein